MNTIIVNRGGGGRNVEGTSEKLLKTGNLILKITHYVIYNNGVIYIISVYVG